MCTRCLNKMLLNGSSFRLLSRFDNVKSLQSQITATVKIILAACSRYFRPQLLY